MSWLDWPVCGQFKASNDTVRWAQEAGLADDPELGALLSGVLRHASERGDPLEFFGDVDSLLELADPPTTALEGIDRLVGHLASRQRTPEATVTLRPRFDYARFYMRGPGELDYYIELLLSRGLVEQTNARFEELNPVQAPDADLRLTPEGWEYADELRRTSRRADQAFVAMWFDESVAEAWSHGFAPALEETGFRPVRLDKEEHNRRIDDEIIAQIRRSGLLVADFTGHRQGVYFEAGFALGLAIPVIWTCRKDELGDAHFDTRQYNHIDWDDPEELKRRLINRIIATVPRP